MKGRKVSSIPVFLVFAVFSVCVLLVILTGAGIYRSVREKDAVSYEWRTRIQYLTTRIHQADEQNGLRAGTFGEYDALVLTEELDGGYYDTYIYCCDGYLREAFTSPDSGLLPEDGERILKAQKMTVTETDGVLELEIDAEDGSSRILRIFLRSERRYEEVRKNKGASA